MRAVALAGVARAALFAAVALVGVLVSAAPAGAHALLTRSEPVGGATLRTAPREVRLFFTEPVRPVQPMSVVRGGGGSVVARAPYVPAGHANEIVIPLRRGLGPGPYAVRWSEVDTADGHVISGAFVFSIGAGLPPVQPAPAQGGGGPSRSAVVSRWLLLAGLLAAAGAVGFALLVSRPVLRAEAPALSERLRRADAFVLAAALGLATLGALLSVVLESGASGTRFGRWTLIGAALAGAGAAAALASLRSKPFRLPAAVAALLLLGLPTATGHAYAPGVHHAVSIPVDLVHLAAAAFWIGGVLELAVVAPLALRGGNAQLQRALARRFSPFAVVAVLTLGATGIVRAFTELVSFHQLWTTGYGQALLVKTGVLAALLVLAALNRRRLSSSSIRAELVLLAVAIGAVAVLTNVRPGRNFAVAAPHARASTTVVVAGEDDDLAVGVALTPRSGNAIDVRATVLGFEGPVRGLDIRFAVESAGATRRAPATACGAGCYRARLSLTGRPRLVSARIAGRGRPPATLRFAAPARWPAPSATAIVRRAEAAIDALRTLVVHSRLASDAHHTVTTIYTMVAPDRLAYHNVGSSDSVIIGNRRWDRQPGDRWIESPQIPSLRQPVPFWSSDVADAHVLRTDRIGGRSVWVVSFLNPGTPAWFTAWIDRSSFRTLQLEMVAAAHFMRDRDGPFNAPVRVEPPGS